MKLPNFCYQKAFWVIVPLLVVSIGSGVSAITAQIDNIDARVRMAEQELANNDVPALKTSLDKRFDKIDNNLEVIKEQGTNTLIELCRIKHGEC